jgi:poly-beta-1,6-N-acetyl-D-glucosamine synthase
MPIALVLLIVGSAIMFYILVGYPILLAVRRSRAAPPVAKDLRYQTTVSTIVCVYNGAGFIGAKLESLLALDYPPGLLEIIVVSDGSEDETDSIVRTFSSRGVQLLTVPHGGKAAALNYGLGHASGEILFFTDVRQPLDPLALRHLVANFADPTVGAVTGELLLLVGEHPGEQADMGLYWRYEVWSRKRHSDIYSIFSSTGCIWALRRNLAEPIPHDTLIDDAVLTLGVFFQGYRVIFDPEAIAYDYPAVVGTEFRRRLRTLAGLWQVHTRLPKLFSGSNRMRFHFLSHKFARLVLPWAILLVFGATLALPASGFRTSLLNGELCMLALALLDPLMGRRFPLKQVSSAARTFLVMNAASLASIVVFFAPATWLWRPTQVTTTDGKTPPRVA